MSAALVDFTDAASSFAMNPSPAVPQWQIQYRGAA